MIRILGSVFILGFAAAAFSAEKEPKAAAKPDWSMNATIIEACSCPMFCQCYFMGEPASHGGHEGHAMEHFCKFNNAYKVNKGKYGNVKLEGAKFWFTGDLGGDFAKGNSEWAILTYDPSVKPEQRTAIKEILGQVYPVKWKSFEEKEAPVEWVATKDAATAKLDGGKAGEIVLKRSQGMTDEPVVMKNLRYFAAPRNDGFLMMQNEIETYKVGERAFEFKGTNGFMITFDMSSKDVK